MRKEEFYFNSKDGKSKIHGVRYLPEQKKIEGIVQIVHGMAEYVEKYEHFAEFLTEHGILVTGEDHLGHGKTVQKGDICGYFCEQNPASVVVEDVHQLKNISQTLYPDVPYFMLGHSMGSFILRNYLFSYGTGITGAVIMGTGMQSAFLIKIGKIMVRCLKVLFGEKHKSKFVQFIVFGAYNQKIQKPRTIFDWLSKDENYVDSYVKDSTCGFCFTLNGFQTLFEIIAEVQKKKNLKNVPKELPLLLVSGTDDPVGEYGKGVLRTVESLKEAGLTDIQMKMYETDRHEILNETDKEQVMQDIYSWLKSKMQKGL